MPPNLKIRKVFLDTLWGKFLEKCTVSIYSPEIFDHLLKLSVSKEIGAHKFFFGYSSVVFKDND